MGLTITCICICIGVQEIINKVIDWLSLSLTSDRLFNVLLFGRNKTSLKSNLISLSMRGMMVSFLVDEVGNLAVACALGICLLSLLALYCSLAT